MLLGSGDLWCYAVIFAYQYIMYRAELEQGGCDGVVKGEERIGCKEEDVKVDGLLDGSNGKGKAVDGNDERKEENGSSGKEEKDAGPRWAIPSHTQIHTHTLVTFA